MIDLAIPSTINHRTFRRVKNVWYTVKAGAWNDPTIWQGNAYSPSSAIPYQYPGQMFSNTSAPVFPLVGDDVFIGHAVTLPGALSLYANNCFVSAFGSLIGSGTSGVLNVAGDLQCNGTVTLTSTYSLQLAGTNNFISSFSSASTSFVVYNGRTDQNIMNLNYGNLSIRTSGMKYMVSNLSVAGSLSVQGGTLSQADYNLTVSGISAFIGGGYTCTSGASSLFTGLVTFSSGSIQINGTPAFEFRGGITATTTVSLGSANVNFTTNSQSITATTSFSLGGNVTIVGNITVTNSVVTGATNTGLSVNNIAGTTASSTLSNKGNLIVFVTTMPMAALGIFLYNDDPASMIGFFAPVSFTLPYTSFASMSTGGDGLKYLAGNTTVTGNLGVVNGTTTGAGLECNAYTLTVSGTTRMFGPAVLYKSGAGTALFTGLINASGGANITIAGGAVIECRGGITGGSGTVISGTGSLLFTTNNQTIGASVTSFVPITISGAITVTVDVVSGQTTGTLQVRFSNIDGNNPASKLLIKPACTFNCNINTLQMNTGLFDSSLGTTNYQFSGAQPVRGGTYTALILSNSGVKSLQGNVTVPTANYSVTGTATLNLNGFTLTLT